MNNSLPNPLIETHRTAETETLAYDQVEIVNTFGEPGREYGAIFESCALMDMPQRGVLELTGTDRLPFLNNLISNVTWDKNTKNPMPVSTGVYAFFLNLRGRIARTFATRPKCDRSITPDHRRARLAQPATCGFADQPLRCAVNCIP